MTQKNQKQRIQAKQTKPSQPKELTFLDHFYELRNRLFWVVIALVVTSAAGFQYKDQLISVVMAPLHGQKLVYLTPAGGFSFIFTLSIYFGVLLSIPVIVYQLYKFLRPLMNEPSRRFVATMISLSILLAAAGAMFGYFVTIPGAINFLSTFAGDVIIPNLTAESYLSFVVAYVLGLAVLFQLPLLLYLFDHIRPIPPGMLMSTQRYVIIGATIMAAVITPTPDAINMMIVAVPIVVVYEFGVVAVAIRHSVRRHRSKAKNVVYERQDEKQEFIIDVADDLIKPVDAPVPPQAVLRTTRTIDGVLVTRKVPSVIVAQVRPDATPVVAPQRPTANRPFRTTDGFIRSVA
ncbi:MAG: twin-arginine translocase subunit TatC [Candidatus Saccharimonadales bacterium]